MPIFTLDDPALDWRQVQLRGHSCGGDSRRLQLQRGDAPVTYTKTEQLVAQLFTTRDHRLSVVQHGNNHDGYEFYKYTSQPGDAYPARPIED